MSDMTIKKEGNKLIMERTVDAKRDSVWDAFTRAELFEKWWGPRGWQTTVPHFDFSEGGYLLYCMKCVDEAQGEWFGQESWGKSVYEKINAKDGFTYTDYFCDAHGTVTEGMPETYVEMQFIEVGDKTKIVSIGTYASEKDLDTVLQMGMEEGVRQTWDRLSELLEDKNNS